MKEFITQRELVDEFIGFLTDKELLDKYRFKQSLRKQERVR